MIDYPSTNRFIKNKTKRLLARALEKTGQDELLYWVSNNYSIVEILDNLYWDVVLLMQSKKQDYSPRRLADLAHAIMKHKDVARLGLIQGDDLLARKQPKNIYKLQLRKKAKEHINSITQREAVEV